MKVVLVTGGSAGMGHATAIEFAKLGYRVAFTGRDLERLNKTLDELVQHSPEKSADNLLKLEANFEHEAEVEPIVDKVVEKFGKLDIVINNAGTPGSRLTFEKPGFYEDFKKIMQVNLMASTRIAQLSMPHLIKTKGVLINVSSICDRIAMPHGSYCISKAGMSMMTKALANALDGTGVRVLTVAPGPILTNFSPRDRTTAIARNTSLARPGESQEVANTIVFLCSDKASYIHACTIDVDGGFVTRANNMVKGSS